MHHYSHHIGDYRRDTMHLTLLEHGCYRQLLDLYYLNECALDANALRLVCARTAEEMQAAESVLNEFFEKTESGWIHKRCETEIANYRNKSSKARASADARWQGKPKNDANAMRTHSEGNANQEPLTNNQLTTLADKSASKRRARLPAYFYPNEAGVSKAEALGINLAIELGKFRDYHQAKGSTMADWQAAWRTWVSNSSKFNPRAGPKESSKEKANREVIEGLTGYRRAEQNERDITGEVVRLA